MDFTLDIIALVLAFPSFILSIWNVTRTNNLIDRNHKIDIFTTCTHRYHDIILQMPEEMLDEQIKQLTPSILKHCMLYFDLCSEEFQLYKKDKKIDDDTWGKWTEGMKKNINNNDLYKDAWIKLYNHYNKDFRDFIDTKILNKEI